MRKLLVTLGISILGAAPGCRGSGEPRVASALTGLPEYTPEEAAAFDDVLAPTVFGLKADVDLDNDPHFATRVGHADWVARARISTVSKEELAGKDGYTLALSPEGTPFAGNQSATAVELRVPQGSPSYERLEVASSSLIGKRVVLFLRRYADRGEATNHWHGEADDEKVVALIRHQKALDAQGAEAQTKD